MNHAVRITLTIAVSTKLALTGCVDDDPGGGGTTNAPEDCSEPDIGPMASNPGYRGTITGLDAPAGKTWTSVAVGHVDPPSGGGSCCEDYVLASDSSRTITVVYGAPSNGLVAFSDEPDDEWSAGPVAVEDVALRDVTGDGLSDLLALLTDGTFSVRRGQPAEPYFEETIDIYAASAGSAVGRSRILIADVDCDSALDVLVPTDEGFLFMLNDGTGVFGAPIPVSSHTPLEWMDIGDLDNDDEPDVVGVSANGTFSVWSGACDGFAFSEAQGLLTLEGTYEGARIALGHFCPGHANNLAVAVSWGDVLDVYCGDGSGSFDVATEPHGEEGPNGEDYTWEFSELVFTEQRVTGIGVGGSGPLQEIYIQDKITE